MWQLCQPPDANADRTYCRRKRHYAAHRTIRRAGYTGNTDSAHCHRHSTRRTNRYLYTNTDSWNSACRGRFGARRRAGRRQYAQ